mmetsp:Transcript_23216/g.39853  ORF Transcript_23216/g.39853 Transcript_23216/m.39853 type:complete len:232 (-) Transcript_23216:238-933(-)
MVSLPAEPTTTSASPSSPPPVLMVSLPLPPIKTSRVPLMPLKVMDCVICASRLNALVGSSSPNSWAVSIAPFRFALTVMGPPALINAARPDESSFSNWSKAAPKATKSQFRPVMLPTGVPLSSTARLVMVPPTISSSPGGPTNCRFVPVITEVSPVNGLNSVIWLELPDTTSSPSVEPFPSNSAVEKKAAIELEKVIVVICWSSEFLKCLKYLGPYLAKPQADHKDKNGKR